MNKLTIHGALGMIAAMIVLAPSTSHALIGGEARAQDEGVYMLDIQMEGDERALCSGVAIAPRVFLTAGHCVAAGFVGLDPTFQIFTGSDLDKATPKQWFEVTHRHLHPDFNQAFVQGGSDLAILITARDLPRHLPLAKEPLPELVDEFEVIGYGVAGLGDLTDLDTKGGRRRRAVIPVSMREEGVVHIGDAQTLPCYGDSGAPLLHQGAVVGIMSHGPRQCRDAMAAYLTHPHMDFIKAYTLNMAGEPDEEPPIDASSTQDEMPAPEVPDDPACTTAMTRSPATPTALLLWLWGVGSVWARRRVRGEGGALLCHRRLIMAPSRTLWRVG